VIGKKADVQGAPDAAEAALNVGQRLEFHFSNDWFE